MVVDVVFVIVFARGDELEFGERSGGGEETDLAGSVAVGQEEQVGAATSAFNVNTEAFVGLFVKQCVGF